MKKSSLLVAFAVVLFSTVFITASVTPPQADQSQAAHGLRAFFDRTLEGLGGNGRSCADCHMPTDAFQLSPASIEARFQRLQTERQENPDADDPLFRPIDADDFRVNDELASDYTTCGKTGWCGSLSPCRPTSG